MSTSPVTNIHLITRTMNVVVNVDGIQWEGGWEGGGEELSAALIIDHFQAEKSPLFHDSSQLVYEALIHGIKSVLFDVVSTPPCIHSSVRFNYESRA